MRPRRHHAKNPRIQYHGCEQHTRYHPMCGTHQMFAGHDEQLIVLRIILHANTTRRRRFIVAFRVVVGIRFLCGATQPTIPHTPQHPSENSRARTDRDSTVRSNPTHDTPSHILNRAVGILSIKSLDAPRGSEHILIKINMSGMQMQRRVMRAMGSSSAT
jgi:hypothetical protein